VFWDKAARDAGKAFIELRSISALVLESQLNSSLYEILYRELQVKYPNSIEA
jgi:hypothetical protein